MRISRVVVHLLAAAVPLAGSALAAAPVFTEIARKDAASAKYCPDATDGAFCRMSHPDAVKHCQERAADLPLTREFGALAQANGSKGLLELDYVREHLGGVPPKDYYKVDSDDGDTFYFNNSGYAAPEGPLGVESFWTASIVTKKPQYAHVYYGKLGGGGGTPEEHKLTYRHAVLCVVRPEK